MKLTLEYFRGATQPFEIDFGGSKGTTILYGENGSGKTTIVDAFEFLGDGTAGSISDKKTGTTGHAYLPSLGKKAKDVKVTLETGVGRWEATLKGAKRSISSKGPIPIIQTLRRRKITDLIEAAPGEKYKSIHSFIELPILEKNEEQLYELCKSLDDSIEHAAQSVSHAQDVLNREWDAAKGTGISALAWALELVKDYDSKTTPKAHPLTDLKSEIDKALQVVSRFLEEAKETEEKKETFEKANKDSEKLASQSYAEPSDVLQLLQEAETYVEKHLEITACPVCANDVNGEQLKKTLSERISSFRELSEAIQKSKKAEAGFQNAKERLAKIRSKLLPLSRNFESQLTALEKEIAEAKFHISDDLLEALKFDADAPKADWEPQAESCQKLLEEEQAALASAIQKWQGELQLKKTLHTHLKTITAQKQIHKQHTEQRKVAGAIHSQVKKTRKAEVERILSSMAHEVSALYEKVHKGEGLSKIELQLDPKKRASMNITTELAGEKGLLPQAYFSESHLDLEQA